MPLNAKNKFFFREAIFVLTCSVLIISCQNGKSTEEITELEKKKADSLSKARQKRVVDSLRKDNPLLIIPPDSEYTGDYIDKYPQGIIKFKGFFRQGQRHGQWMSFYPTGVIWSELTFDKGIKSGPNIAYFQDGKKRYEGYFKNDLKDSIWTYYDTSGVIMERVLYEKDLIKKRMPFVNTNKK